MKREALLKSREYWINEIQNDLYGVIEKYMADKDITRTDLAAELGVTKGYISQVLKGDFDHKISKMVDLSLAAGQVPVLKFVDLQKFVEDDKDGKTYDLYAITRPENIRFNVTDNYHLPYLEFLQEDKGAHVLEMKMGTVLSNSLS